MKTIGRIIDFEETVSLNWLVIFFVIILNLIFRPCIEIKVFKELIYRSWEMNFRKFLTAFLWLRYLQISLIFMIKERLYFLLLKKWSSGLSLEPRTISSSLTPTLTGGLCPNHRSLNRLFVNFFECILLLLSKISFLHSLSNQNFWKTFSCYKKIVLEDRFSIKFIYEILSKKVLIKLI